MVDDLSNSLKKLDIPEPSAETKSRTLQMAMQVYEKEQKETVQGMVEFIRPIHKENTITSWIRSLHMKRAYAFAGSFAAVAVVLAVTTTHYSDVLKEVNPPQTMIDVVAPSVPPTEQDKDVKLPAQQPQPVPATLAESGIKKEKTESNDSINMNAPGMMRGNAEVTASASAPMIVYGASQSLRDEPAARQAAKSMASESIAGKVAAAPGMPANEMKRFDYSIMPQVPPQQYQYQGGDRFEYKQANAVKSVAAEPVSTFSIDVDTSSYSFVRRMINQGTLPQQQMVRVEEMINYFPYNYATPEDNSHPFKPTIAVAPSPWNSAKKLVHIGIKGYERHYIKRPAANLVFLIDVSGSMNSQDKLPLVKSALHMLVDQITGDDTISIVTYAGYAGTALAPTSGANKQDINRVIDMLGAGGSTAGAAGIEQAYTLAQQHFNKDGVNRVILATDGDFNVGMSNDEQLKQYISQKRESGISLSVLGFGQGNYNDALMQALAQNGNGNAAYIDNINEARKVLVDEISSTLFTIAKDVKIQVEWNPATISEYRLVGYETRLLNREDFNNDKVDAGEVGAGHAVTAIYEITPKGATGTTDPLRYGGQQRPELDKESSSEFSSEYGFLKIRYKQPEGSESTLITTPIDTDEEVADLSNAPEDTRFAIAVAGFGQLLKQDPAVSGISYDSIVSLADGARANDPHGLRQEFVDLVRRARALQGGGVVYPIDTPEPQPLPAPGIMR